MHTHPVDEAHLVELAIGDAPTLKAVISHYRCGECGAAAEVAPRLGRIEMYKVAHERWCSMVNPSSNRAARRAARRNGGRA